MLGALSQSMGLRIEKTGWGERPVLESKTVGKKNGTWLLEGGNSQKKSVSQPTTMKDCGNGRRRSGKSESKHSP